MNLGGGVRSLSEILPEIEREKARRGRISSGERDEELTRIGEISSDLRAHTRSDAPFWSRSYGFWHQMFFDELFAGWLHYAGPILIAHGTEDLESVPWSSVRSAVADFPPETRGRVRFVFYDGLGHDLVQPVVMRDVGRWIADREREIGTGSAPRGSRMPRWCAVKEAGTSREAVRPRLRAALLQRVRVPSR